MDVLLVSIAALSLILAIAMGLILFKVLRDERQRPTPGWRRSRRRRSAGRSARWRPPADDLRRADHVVRTWSDLFTVSDERLAMAPGGRRAALARVVIGWRWRCRHGGPILQPRRGRAAVAPLELLSLNHTQQPRADRSRFVATPTRGPSVHRCSRPRFSSVRTAIS